MSQTWEQPTIAVDVIAYTINPDTRKTSIVLVKRQHEPHKGVFALPGVLMLAGERAVDAATRAINTKIGSNTKITMLKDVGISDIPGRDERGPSLSIIMIALVELPVMLPDTVKRVAPTDAIEATLPFDHHEMIVRTNHVIEQELLNSKEFTEALLGEKFTTNDVYNTLSAVRPLNTPLPDKTNLSRRIRGLSWVAKTEPLSTSSKGRPSSMWSTQK